MQVAFLKTKEEISRNVTLPYFNPRSDTTLQTDASKKGLGAVILQDLKPVMLCIKGLDWGREELPKLGEGMLSNNLGNGEIFITFSMANTLHLRLTKSL